MPDWSRAEFEWDDGNVDHLIDRHRVEPEQAEQVFRSRLHVRRAGDVYHAFGRDDSGQYLFVVFVLRDSVVRVISARSMTARERGFYERQR